jgi:transposase-like protein
MTRIRKVIDERDARACLAAAQATGQATADWAREHGVDGRSLNAWRINLAQRASTAVSKPRLVELVPMPSSATEARYVVRVADAEVEVTDAFREETLVRIVRALRSC